MENISGSEAVTFLNRRILWIQYPNWQSVCVIFNDQLASWRRHRYLAFIVKNLPSCPAGLVFFVTVYKYTNIAIKQLRCPRCNKLVATVANSQKMTPVSVSESKVAS